MNAYPKRRGITAYRGRPLDILVKNPMWRQVMIRFFAGLCAGILLAGAYPQAEEWLRSGAEKTSDIVHEATRR